MQEKATESYVKLHINKGIGYIEFFHPNRNSISSDILKTFESARNNNAIHVIVLKVVVIEHFVLVLVLMK